MTFEQLFRLYGILTPVHLENGIQRLKHNLVYNKEKSCNLIVPPTGC